MKSLKLKKSGFTLIEILITFAIIAVASVAIYTTYNRQQAQTLVKNQTIYLQQLSAGIKAAYSTSGNLSLLNVSNVIATRASPRELIQGAALRNVWGGNITFENIAGTPPIYGIIIGNVPQNACAILATTDFANLSHEVVVNGTSVKIAGEISTSQTVSAAALACADNNTLIFRNRLDSMLAPALSVDPVRPKENPYYIAGSATGPIISPAVACAGGTSWNGSFCSCPTNSEWNGTACIAYNSRPGACSGGQGWNGSTCAALPPITLPPPTSTIAEANSQGGTKYRQGRYVPNTVADAAVAQTNVGTACMVTPVLQGIFDGKTCQTCVNGAWNGFRCVTP